MILSNRCHWSELADQQGLKRAAMAPGFTPSRTCGHSCLGTKGVVVKSPLMSNPKWPPEPLRTLPLLYLRSGGDTFTYGKVIHAVSLAIS